jgi:hypothetical protein
MFCVMCKQLGDIEDAAEGLAFAKYIYYRFISGGCKNKITAPEEMLSLVHFVIGSDEIPGTIFDTIYDHCLDILTASSLLHDFLISDPFVSSTCDISTNDVFYKY